MILYFSADLLWASKIKGTADALGLPCRPARSVEMLLARLSDSPVKALVVDLEAGEPGRELIAHLRSPQATPQERGVHILVFGPHVDTEGFAEVRRLGADQTMTRGALSARLPEVLQELSART